MWVERVSADDGFLRDLDLELRPGLNVIIGPRGVGKTSVVEALRFILNAKSFSKEAADVGYSHLMAILDDGQVSAWINDGSTYRVQRRLSDASWSSEDLPEASVFAQNEVERLGTRPASRLALIDVFRTGRRANRDRLAHLTSTVSSTTAELAELIRDRDTLREAVAPIPGLESELAHALAAQQSAVEESSATAEDLGALRDLQSQFSVLTAALASIEDLVTAYRDWAQAAASLGPLPADGTSEWMSTETRQTILSLRDLALDAQRQATSSANRAAEALERERLAVAERRATVGDRVREVRGRVETVQEGFGILARQVADLEGRLAVLRQAADQLVRVEAQIRELAARRADDWDAVDQAWQERTQQRRAVAAGLNASVGPVIKVEVSPLADTSAYREALQSSLRGSGLHYAELAPKLAASLMPRELVDLAERDDVRGLASAAGLATERAEKLVRAIRQQGMPTLATVSVDDVVHLSLLDGGMYKDTDSLSVGQRCTVVLPIILSRRGNILVLDQPEDHLDNAFITTTLVRSLIAKKREDQVIVTTHNPNIPVLGDADWVVVLGSDGRSSHVRHAGTLLEPRTVDAIVETMEGGRQAFDLRRRYYAGEHVHGG